MPMTLRPCGSCPNWTYSRREHDGRVICDPCLDALLYVQTAPLEDLRALIAANTDQTTTLERP